jgi:hypothetical protein
MLAMPRSVSTSTIVDNGLLFDVRLLLVKVQNTTVYTNGKTTFVNFRHLVVDEWSSGELALFAIRSVLDGMDIVQMRRSRAKTQVQTCTMEGVDVQDCALAAKRSLIWNGDGVVGSASNSGNSSTSNNNNNYYVDSLTLDDPVLSHIRFTPQVFASPSVCLKCKVSVESTIQEWRHDSVITFGADSWAFSCVDPPNLGGDLTANTNNNNDFDQTTEKAVPLSQQVTLRAPSDSQLLAAAGSIELSSIVSTTTTTAAVLGAPAVVTALAAALTLGRCRESPSTLYRLWRDAEWFLGPWRVFHDAGDTSAVANSNNNMNNVASANNNIDPMIEASAAIGTFMIAVLVVIIHVLICAIAARWYMHVVSRYEHQEDSFQMDANKIINKYAWARKGDEKKDDAKLDVTKQERQKQKRKSFRDWFKEMAIKFKFPSLTIRILMMLHPLASITSFYTVAHVKSQLTLNPKMFVATTVVGCLCILFPFFIFWFVSKTASSRFSSAEAFSPTLNTTSSNEKKDNNNNNVEEEQKEKDDATTTTADEKYLGGLFFMEVPEQLYFYKSIRNLSKIPFFCCANDNASRKRKAGDDDKNQQQQQLENVDVDDVDHDDEFEIAWRKFVKSLVRAIKSFVLPVGRWGPTVRFRRFGSPISRLLPLWSVAYAPWEPVFVIALAFLLAVPIHTWTGCITQYLLLAAFAFWNVVVTWRIQPFRTKLFWLTHACTWISLCVICLAATLVRHAPWIIQAVILPAFTVLFGVAVFDLLSVTVIGLIEWNDIDGKTQELWTWNSDYKLWNGQQDDEEEAKERVNDEEMTSEKNNNNNLSSLFSQTTSDKIVEREQQQEELLLLQKSSNSNSSNDDDGAVMLFPNNQQQRKKSNSNSSSTAEKSQFSSEDTNNNTSSNLRSRGSTIASQNPKNNAKVIKFGKATGGGALTLSELQRCLALPDEILNEAPIHHLEEILMQRRGEEAPAIAAASSASPQNNNKTAKKKKKKQPSEQQQSTRPPSVVSPSSFSQNEHNL